MLSSIVGVVTGANRGLGKSAVEEFCSRLGAEAVVVLACRDIEAGNKARSDILNRHPRGQILVQQLDVGDTSSIERFALEIRRQFPDGLDFLVNNAGFSYPEATDVPFLKQARDTLAVNYFGTLHLLRALLPMLRSARNFPEGHGDYLPRVVNVASTGGQMAFAKLAEPLRNRFQKVQTESEVTVLMEEFLSEVRSGMHVKHGWPAYAYGISKLGVMALSKVIAKPDEAVVTSCCPGWCITDMAVRPGGAVEKSGRDLSLARSSAQGASEFVHLALPARLGGDARGHHLHGKYVQPQQGYMDARFSTLLGSGGGTFWDAITLRSMAHGGKPCPPESAKL